MFKSFFYSGGKFQPVYAWITIFCFLVALGVVLRFFSIGKLSDGLILGLCGFIQVWVIFYNSNKKGENNIKIAEKELDFKKSVSKL